METQQITEEMNFQCFAAAQQSEQADKTAESFVDVEEYEITRRTQIDDHIRRRVQYHQHTDYDDAARPPR